MRFLENEIITVITPTYNRAQLLPRVYDSLCAQTYRQFEWIIVDDGSSDNTTAIVEKWIAEKKMKIRFFYQKKS